MFNQIQALVPPWGCADVSAITSIGWIWTVPVQMARGSLARLQSPRLSSLNGYVCPKWQAVGCGRPEDGLLAKVEVCPAG